MTRKVISVRLGHADASPMGEADEQFFAFDVLGPKHKLTFGLGQVLDELAQAGLSPSETAIDLGILALALTAADTRISRKRSAQDGWSREMRLDVPVSNPALWTTARPVLTQMLGFLTGDRWAFSFRPRPSGCAVLSCPEVRLSLATKPEVCLFSGGLDSFIGAIDLCAAGRTPLLVSHYWDGETSKYQMDCVQTLRARYPKISVQHVRSRVGFRHDVLGTGESENTQRGRSFLFFTLATMAADAIGGPQTVLVPENGLISLNVPLDPLRLGSLSTRTTHPFYMARFNDLLSILGLKITLSNPYGFKTKGEMVSGCLDQALIADEARNTMSCSSPAKARWKKAAPMHCGFCVPCLIRRASLLAGLGSDKTDYNVPDLGAADLNSAKAEGMHVRSFQHALARLRKNPSRAAADIHLPGPLVDHPGDLARFEKVYRDGMREVEVLLAGVRTTPR